jgi:ribosomal 50S subunit-associated protein YjgA (DUF615 family)
MQHAEGTYNKGKKISNNKKGIYVMLKGQIKAKEKEIKRLKSELEAKRKELLEDFPMTELQEKFINSTKNKRIMNNGVKQ